MIKKIAALCLGLGYACVAVSAEWVWVYDQEGYRQELDRESLVKTADGVQVWDRVIPPGGMAADPEGFLYRYVITWSDYDCKHPRISVKRRIYVGDNARQVKKQKPLLHPDIVVKPGSPREKLWAAACGKAVVSKPLTQSKPAVRRSGTDKPVAPRADASPVTIPLVSMAAPELLPNRREAEVMKQPERKVTRERASLPPPVASSSAFPLDSMDCIACIACTNQCRIPAVAVQHKTQPLSFSSNTGLKTSDREVNRAALNVQARVNRQPARPFLPDQLISRRVGEIVEKPSAF